MQNFEFPVRKRFSSLAKRDRNILIFQFINNIFRARVLIGMIQHFIQEQSYWIWLKYDNLSTPFLFSVSQSFLGKIGGQSHPGKPTDQLISAPTSNSVSTSNAAESFHSQQRTEFYTPHPSIFHVIKSLEEQQPLRRLKISAATKGHPPRRRKDLIEKENFVSNQFQRYQSHVITRNTYLRSMGNRFVAI